MHKSGALVIRIAVVIGMIIGLTASGSPLSTASAAPPDEAGLPTASIMTLVARHYDWTDLAVVRLADTDPVAAPLRSQGAEAFAVTGHVNGSRDLVKMGAVLATARGVVVSIYAPGTGQYDVTPVDSRGAMGKSSLVAAPGECELISGAILALDATCYGFGEDGNPLFIVCGTIRGPLLVINALSYVACAFDVNANYTIAVHQIPNGGTECTYGSVSGQYYTQGATCRLRYQAERGPVRNFPDTPPADIVSVGAYISFFARSDTGYDVGSNDFSSDKFTWSTVVAGYYHTFRERVPLQTGTNSKPRFGRAMIAVSYSDQSFAAVKDAYPIN